MKNYKNLITSMLLLLVCQGVIAQSHRLKDTVNLHQVNVWADRKIENTGVTRTKIDSIILRESICNSLSELISQNTTIFIKSYGKGSLATASFRGTAPSHTQVTWNGMMINSPMLGMVDFSLIPSYFVDDMNLLHGAGSIDACGGALGGAIILNNNKIIKDNKLHLVQAFASYNSYDSYLKYNYGWGNLKFSTRFFNTISSNDFTFRNMDKNLNIETDKNGNKYKSIDSAPKEKNKNGEYRNTHLLQEIYYKLNNHHHFSLITWAYQSDRHIPMLTTVWGEGDELEKLKTNTQEDVNLRSVFSWKCIDEKYDILSRVGYSYNELNYLLRTKVTNGYNDNIVSKSTINNIYTEIDANYNILENLKITAKFNYNLFNIDSFEEKNQTGYKKYRAELSPYIAIRYKVFNLWGLSYNLRKTINNDVSSPLIHAFLTDFLLWDKYNLIVKSSIIKNFHAPSLNDLYFQPGGNPDLKTEDGISYDIGIEFEKGTADNSLSGSANYYKSDINNWILWLPSFKGYWEPRNVKNVISKGIELKLSLKKKIGNFNLFVDSNWAQTQSLNYDKTDIWGDESYGKQLVYIPEYSSGLMCKINWKNFFTTYKVNHYSKRYTSSSNDLTKRDDLATYIMNDISFGGYFDTKYGRMDISLAINNLFNEEYQSVLKRPMPRTNYNLILSYKL